MMSGVVSSFFALFATALNSARVETVVVDPPLPPVVLYQAKSQKCNLCENGAAYPPFVEA